MPEPTETQSEHAIRWMFDNGGVTGTAICTAAPDADCRLTSVTCECERWGEIRRDEAGVAWHKIVDYGDSTEPLWHELKQQDECNVCLFINDTGCAEELAPRGTRFELAVTPIRPIWQDDGCDWEPAVSLAAAEVSHG